VIHAAYFDSSAILKLVLDEPESDALRRWAREVTVRLSSTIAAIEVVRAARKEGRNAARQAAEALVAFDIKPLGIDVVQRAATTPPLSLRSLDAIHLATSLTLGEEGRRFVTYDRRLAEAATAAGLEVVAPA
jgi:predicted nucleic acid-binding protein